MYDINMGGKADPQPLVGSRRAVRSGLWMIAMAILLFAVIAFLQRDRDGGGPASTPTPTVGAAVGKTGL